MGKFFPVKGNRNIRPYTAHMNGYAYAVFLETMRRNRLPIRVIGTSNNIPRYNFLATIEQFKWSIDKVGDINYEIQLRKFPKTILSMANWAKEKYKIFDNFVRGRIDRRTKLKLIGNDALDWIEQL